MKTKVTAEVEICTNEGKYLLSLTVITLKPRLCVHNVADNSAVKLKHERKLGDEIRMRAHRMDEIMLVCARFIDVPKRLACKLFN